MQLLLASKLEFSLLSVVAMQKRLVADFVEAVDGIQHQQEARMQQQGPAGQLAKDRRKALRAMVKVWTHTPLIWLLSILSYTLPLDPL